MRAQRHQSPSRTRRSDEGKREKITMPRVMCAGRGRSDAHLASRLFVSETTMIGIDCEYLEDKVTLGEQEAGPSPIPGHEVVDHAGDDHRCAPVQGHSASLVCAGFGMSDCGNGRARSEWR